MTANEALIYAASAGYCVTEDGKILNPAGRELKSQANRDGYLWFRPAKASPPVRVHRLQAFQKFGHLLFGDGIQVRHLDGNPKNTRRDNIEIGTASQNMMDKPAESRRAVALKATAKVRKHDHAAILKRRAEGANYETLSREFGIKSWGTLSFICNRSHSLTPASV